MFYIYVGDCIGARECSAQVRLLPNFHVLTCIVLLSRSPVLPSSRSLAMPLSRSPVLLFSRGPVLPFSCCPVVERLMGKGGYLIPYDVPDTPAHGLRCIRDLVRIHVLLNACQLRIWKITQTFESTRCGFRAPLKTIGKSHQTTNKKKMSATMGSALTNPRPCKSIKKTKENQTKPQSPKWIMKAITKPLRKQQKN